MADKLKWHNYPHRSFSYGGRFNVEYFDSPDDFWLLQDFENNTHSEHKSRKKAKKEASKILKREE